MTLVDLLEALNLPPSWPLRLKLPRFQRRLNQRLRTRRWFDSGYALRGASQGRAGWRFRMPPTRFQRFVECGGLTLKKPLDDLSQVLQQVPTIGDLAGLGDSFSGCLSIRRRTVPADDFNIRLVAEPRLYGVYLAIGQKVDGLASVEIH
jgi:hypothetical protein